MVLEHPEFRMIYNSCIQAALNARLTDGGTLTWTGTGDWTPGTISPMISDPMICVEWMDPRLLSVNIGQLYIFGEILYVINIERIWTDPQKYCKNFITNLLMTFMILSAFAWTCNLVGPASGGAGTVWTLDDCDISPFFSVSCP